MDTDPRGRPDRKQRVQISPDDPRMTLSRKENIHRHLQKCSVMRGDDSEGADRNDLCLLAFHETISYMVCVISQEHLSYIPAVCISIQMC